MEKLLRTVKAQLESWKEWHTTRKIVLAVSGGVDSMVLLHIMSNLLKLRQYSNRQLVVAHFDHALREDSQEDWALIQKVVEAHDVIYMKRTWHSPATHNVEASAREARYQFFAEVIKATEADVLMTAHHLNDVAETFMMRLMRGTSLRGVRGIQSNYTRLLITANHEALMTQVMRPLIHVTKEEIVAYANYFNVEYIEDETNALDCYTRNRIRKYHIPSLVEENPQFLSNILSLQEQLQSSYSAHYANYLRVEPRLAMYSRKHYWILYIPEFLALSSAEFQVYLTLFFEERLIEEIPHYRRDVLRQLEQMMRNTKQPNRQLQLGNGWIARKKYDYVQIMPEIAQEHNQFAEQLVIERENEWYYIDATTRIGLFAHHQVTTEMKNKATALLLLHLGKKRPLLTLRHRQPGDKMTLAYSDGTIYHKKVSRLLMGQKIPLHQRKKAWVVCDENEEIVWLLPDIVAANYRKQTMEKTTHILLYEQIKGES